MEKIFDNLASIILIRVTLAAVVAFVSGAFVQRLLLADFAVKVGPAGIELGEVSRTSAMSVERLSKSIEDLAVQTRAKTDDLGAILRELRDSVRALRDHIE